MNKFNSLVIIIIEKIVQILSLVLVARYADQEMLGLTAAMISISQRAAGIGSMDIGRTWLIAENPVSKIVKASIIYELGFVLGNVLTFILVWDWLRTIDNSDSNLLIYAIIIYNALYFQQTIVPFQFYKNRKKYQLNNTSKNVISTLLRMCLILKFPAILIVYFSGIAAQFILTINKSNLYHCKMFLGRRRKNNLKEIIKTNEFRNSIYANLTQLTPLVYIYYLVKICEPADIYYLLLPLTLVGIIMTVLRQWIRVHLISDIRKNEPIIIKKILNIFMISLIFAVIFKICGVSSWVTSLVFPQASTNITENYVLVLSVQMLTISSNLLMVEVARLILNINKIIKYELAFLALLVMGISLNMSLNQFVWLFVLIYCASSIAILTEINIKTK